MPDTSQFLDAARLLVDLQRVSEIVQSFSGCLEPEAIARQTTDGLIRTFEYAFARIWLVESDRTHLKLVASSGMYTRTDGSFARVPMGAFKVGKIAQNRIPFLSNHLADEAWVKDREWAIEHHITGFAGYPLLVGDRVIGVLAMFSHQPLSSEFLEVLQGLCTMLAITLDQALQHQQEKQEIKSEAVPLSLSEQLARLLSQARFSLVGTERSLTASLTCLLIQTAEALRELRCGYCRLSYGVEQIALEAMVVASDPSQDWAIATFSDLLFAASCLGGTLRTLAGENSKVVQVVLTVPYSASRSDLSVRIQCQSTVLQTAFTHLAYLAGLTVTSLPNQMTPLVTDDLGQIETSDRLLWVSLASPQTSFPQTSFPQTSPPRTLLPRALLPRAALAQVDLSTTPSQLREAVAAAAQGKRWGLPAEAEEVIPSEREQEILALLALGLRDRDIATQLYISERTVKFHLNNVQNKLKAKTRCQALSEAIAKGWI